MCRLPFMIISHPSPAPGRRCVGGMAVGHGDDFDAIQTECAFLRHASDAPSGPTNTGWISP